MSSHIMPMHLSKLILVIMLCLPVHAFSQQAANQFRRIDNQKGLSNNHINDIYSDSRGYLWFATVSGLNRYDGYSFKVFKNNGADTATIPDNSIHYIYEDHLGFLWIFNGTGQFSIYDPATESFGYDHELFHKNIPLPSTNISAIKADSSSRLWIANSQEGLFVYTPMDDQTHHIRHQMNDEQSLSTNQITDIALGADGYAYAVNSNGTIDVIDPQTLLVSKRYKQPNPVSPFSSLEYKIFLDADNDLWLYSMDPQTALLFLDRELNQWSEFSSSSASNRISSQIISGMVQDDEGKIWVGTDHGGINIIDKDDFSVKVIVSVPGDETSLSGNSITALHKSQDGIIWIGTFKNGVNYFHEYLYPFDHYRSSPLQEDDFFSNDVNCFAEDKEGNLWIGTNGGGLVFFNRAANTFKTWRHQPGNPQSLSNDIIVSLFIDRQERLWIGTYQGGLNRMEGQRFIRYRHDPADSLSLADDRIWQIMQDNNNNLWVATLGGGLDRYDESNHAFIHHRAGDHNALSSDFTLALLQDSNEDIWIGTSTGLNVLDATTHTIRQYHHNPEDVASLSHNHVLSLLEDIHERLWVGTRNGLNLFDKETQTFRVFGVQDGLPDHNIISLQQDAEGNLWIATLNGLSRMIMDETTGAFRFINYDMLDGLQGAEFNEHASLCTAKGELIFGGANGFNIFFPQKISRPEKQFRAIFTDFRLFNRTVDIGETIDGKVLLNKSLNQTDKISLRHNQNVFSIGFSALNYFQPERTPFRYMLEGFNSDWLETDSQNRLATYTNLNPGTYTFRVKAQNSDGSWSEHDTQLLIEVIPPFYASTLAFIIYGLGFVALVFMLIRSVKTREKKKFLRRQEKAEYNRMREMDAMKTRFFTNVSHEFRTPLTLIITPVEKLLKETSDPAISNQLDMVQRNARRLLSLVNQLLDFRKIEKNTISLNLSQADVVTAARESFASFIDLFESKNLHYHFSTAMDQYHAFFDTDKMEKIIFNLLSNAVKFTPENGRVEMILKPCNPLNNTDEDLFSGREYIELRVIDTGIGIAPERQGKIFERFFQSSDHTANLNQGSGIGLSITLEFVKLHDGSINIESTPGEGSCFIVRLPLKKTGKPAELSPQPDAITSKAQYNPPQAEVSLQNHKKPVVLLIEDNEDLRFYLKENLKSRYKILEAANGARGWEIINSHMPHLIVSDIMMPVLDGISLCHKIKTDHRTSHIPLILLTARDSDPQKLEGLQAGAEDYITKPFNYELLELKIRRLIELRLSFQNIFTQKFAIEPGEIGITSLDEKFLKKTLDLVEIHMADAGFSVEKMGRELGVSRGHLYNKLVALTGKTPLEFIRIMRLKRATQLLGKSQLSVAEIAYSVGFNDPKYFSRYFKETYSMTPTEYARKNMGNTTSSVGVGKGF